jgi:two-component system, NarL family, response regulator YdfI
MTEVLIMSPAKARREWLQEILHGQPGFHVGGTAPTFPFLQSLLNERDANIALIDLEPISELEAAHEWVLTLMDVIPIVLLSALTDGVLFEALIRAERGALLRPDAFPTQISNAIRSVSSGLLIFDVSVMPKMGSAEPPPEELTPRETEVLRLLADGLPNREIAERLHISEHTIKFHIRSILGKLGASSRTEAVTLGFRSGLIEL